MTTAMTNQLTVPGEILTAPATARMLTGDRPTGPLHIGHYFGSLRNRVRLQNQGVDSLVLVADYQVLTDRDSSADLAGHVREIILDYLAVGISPQKSTIFAHSAVPALNQLMLPFLSLVSTSELDRNPTVKDEIAASGRSAVSGLMYTYPAHQAADILFCNATVVPVGDDQLPHLELTRTIARRFNDRYARVFTVPEALLSPAPRVPGLDGTASKMSKSRGNAIALKATADETARLIRGAVTDADRRIGYDPDDRVGVSNLLPHRAVHRFGTRAGRRGHVGGGGAETRLHRGRQRVFRAAAAPTAGVRRRPGSGRPDNRRRQHPGQRDRRCDSDPGAPRDGNHRLAPVLGSASVASGSGRPCSW